MTCGRPTPSSSVMSNATLGPSRLTMRLAILVATIWWRRRWARIASPCLACIALGKAAISSASIVGSSASVSSSAADWSVSLAIDSTTASSGRVSPRPSAPRRSSTSPASSPSTLRSSRPVASSISIVRTNPGRPLAPRASAIDSARLCSRLSSSTSSLTSSVMLASRTLRLSSAQPPLAHFAVERDLDVDLIVRAIDPGAIVDEVGVDAPAAVRKFDPPGLVDGQVGAFADHAGANVARIDAQRVVGGVADLGMGLVRRLDVGADAAEPQQVDRRFQDRRDQAGGVDRRDVDSQGGARLGGQLDLLLAAGDDHRPLRQHLTRS